MKKGLFAAALMATVFAFGQAAWAEGGAAHSGKEQVEKFKKMTPEEREKFHAERKAKWEAMPLKEKVQLIETMRAERRKKSDERWSKLSDEEKVKYVEERMKRKHKFHEEHGGKHAPHGEKGDDHPHLPGDKGAAPEAE